MKRVMVTEKTPWKEAIGKSATVSSTFHTANQGEINLLHFDDEALNQLQSKQYGGFTFHSSELKAI